MYHDVQKFLPLLLPTTTVHMNMWNNAASCHWSFHTPAIVISPAPTAVIPLLYWELLPKFRKFIKNYQKYQQFYLQASSSWWFLNSMCYVCPAVTHKMQSLISFSSLCTLNFALGVCIWPTLLHSLCQRRLHTIHPHSLCDDKATWTPTHIFLHKTVDVIILAMDLAQSRTCNSLLLSLSPFSEEPIICIKIGNINKLVLSTHTAL